MSSPGFNAITFFVLFSFGAALSFGIYIAWQLITYFFPFPAVVVVFVSITAVAFGVLALDLVSSRKGKWTLPILWPWLAVIVVIPIVVVQVLNIALEQAVMLVYVLEFASGAAFRYLGVFPAPQN